MKPVNSKKIQLGVIKIAQLSNAQGGNNNVAASNSSCNHICPTICSQNCPTGIIICTL